MTPYSWHFRKGHWWPVTGLRMTVDSQKCNKGLWGVIQIILMISSYQASVTGPVIEFE